MLMKVESIKDLLSFSYNLLVAKRKALIILIRHISSSCRPSGMFFYKVRLIAEKKYLRMRAYSSFKFDVRQ